MQEGKKKEARTFPMMNHNLPGDRSRDIVLAISTELEKKGVRFFLMPCQQ